MKKFIMTAAVALCAVATATTANAAVNVTQTPGSATYSGPTPTYTFAPGSRPMSTGGTYFQSSSNLDAAPLGYADYYYSVSPNDGPGVIPLAGFGAISSLSFIWGSVDSGNTVTFLNAAGSMIKQVTGADLLGAAANGSQTAASTNPLVTFSFTGADQLVSSMVLSSLPGGNNPSGYSFEIDNLAISAVPEAGTWAMMMLGLGLAGVSLRRRKTSTARLAAA